MGRKVTSTTPKGGTTKHSVNQQKEKGVESLLEQYQQIKDRPAFSVESQAITERKAKAIKRELEKEGYQVIDSTVGRAQLQRIVEAAALPCPMEEVS